MSNRVQQLSNIQYEAKQLFEKKNADYGDAFSEYGTVGVLVRIGDKIKRLQNITNNGINLISNESLRDTLIDLHNYAAMSIMLIDETNTDHDLEEVILEDNNIIELKSWSFKGDSNNTYTCKNMLNVEKNEYWTICNCASFIYSKNQPKICKHIINKNNVYY